MRDEETLQRPEQSEPGNSKSALLSAIQQKLDEGSVPELKLLHSIGAGGSSLIRIPPSDSVPLTERVRRVLDTAALRRLADISQLGMVTLVYPGAKHSRLEHTLGVYQNALNLLSRFLGEASQQGIELDAAHCDAFLLASLVHDAGHWPFCHPIEDMQMDSLPRHEERVESLLREPELDSLLRQDWRCDSQLVVDLLTKKPSEQNGPAARFLASCLSGPIDIDKLDYLQRDSLHCGVEYGKQFDASRLMSSLVIDPETQMLAVGSKGRTAAEMMVFARYIMFSEVYWHHAVRAATAMLQRSVFLLRNRLDLPAMLKLSDADWIAMLRRAAAGSLAEPMVEGLFGARRQLFKRLAEFSFLEGAELHARLARRPYWWLVALSEQLAETIRDEYGLAVAAADFLIDAPPVKLEVDINTTVVFPGRKGMKLGDVSPVTAVLAREQFDNHAKRVRIFVRPGLREEVRGRFANEKSFADVLARCIDVTDQQWA
ncbi:MAG: metal-dependent phosphohydrolase [Planctomycetota bacterium]